MLLLSTDFINVLSQRYLELQPPFELSHVQGVSKRCQMHSHKFVEALHKFELWALKSKFSFIFNV